MHAKTYNDRNSKPKQKSVFTKVQWPIISLRLTMSSIGGKQTQLTGRIIRDSVKEAIWVSQSQLGPGDGVHTNQEAYTPKQHLQA